MRVARFSQVISRGLIGASMLAIAAPALAQAAKDTEDKGLGEIVVTAQKREQNLQDVPLAISAISADKVEKLGISDSRDLSGMAPNVTITQGTTNSAAAVISIRGIPTPASETFGLDTSNGLYVDGIYIGRSGASALDVMDIERIEVLRGPQGTLFGRNTTGGAILVTTAEPSHVASAEFKASYGSFNALTLKGYATTGLGEKAAFDIEGILSRGNGYITNKLDGNQIVSAAVAAAALPSASFTDAAVTGKVPTGLAAGANTPISASDSILVALANLQAQIDAL
jgi:iron complex outermembrane receptor protein